MTVEEIPEAKNNPDPRGAIMKVNNPVYEPDHQKRPNTATAIRTPKSETLYWTTIGQGQLSVFDHADF